jgi:hypothetical protein
MAGLVCRSIRDPKKAGESPLFRFLRRRMLRGAAISTIEDCIRLRCLLAAANVDLAS